MTPSIIKVCGMKHANNIESVLQARPDWMGFIFYDRSPRFVDSYEFISKLKGVKKVGIFVNENLTTLFDIADQCQLDYIQLHGDESVQYCAEVSKKYPVIKAISINEDSDLYHLVYFNGVVDYFLFDTKKENFRGGTGEQFDWEILNSYRGDIPFLISGGITTNDIQKIREFDHPLCRGIDVNSGFEIEPGLKDDSLLSSFIQELRTS